MRFLHTADWHIGQFFHEYDRAYEHQQFLNWLLDTLVSEKIDVLLISGDVFDLSNPSASSVKMFYTFLNKAIKANQGLQIVITAGNHDSASRLESPKPLLESSNIHIIGLVQKNDNGEVEYDKLLIPIVDHEGNIKVWCLAIPFLRLGDYPSRQEGANSYLAGITAIYKESFEFASKQLKSGQSVIAMGHLHAQGAEISDMDKSERQIMGGVESISASVFNEEIKYVALGHIHKAQKVGGKEHIRYCGSPLPMSFSERMYKHQVIVFDIINNELSNLKSVEVPVIVPLLCIPVKHQSLEEVLILLEQLPLKENDSHHSPYLEVRILLDGPEPSLRHRVETILEDKNVRLAKIDVKYPMKEKVAHNHIYQEQLQELQPLDIFKTVFKNKYQSDVPESLEQLFVEISMEVQE